jgi:cobalamin-dependent methionine synthase I
VRNQAENHQGQEAGMEVIISMLPKWSTTANKPLMIKSTMGSILENASRARDGRCVNPGIKKDDDGTHS